MCIAEFKLLATFWEQFQFARDQFTQFSKSMIVMFLCIMNGQTIYNLYFTLHIVVNTMSLYGVHCQIWSPYLTVTIVLPENSNLLNLPLVLSGTRD